MSVGAGSEIGAEAASSGEGRVESGGEELRCGGDCKQVDDDGTGGLMG